MLGDFEITALSDGVMKLKPDEILKNTDAEYVRNVMSVNFLSTPTTKYQVESDGKTLILWGDLVHVAAAQLPQPGIGQRPVMSTLRVS